MTLKKTTIKPLTIAGGIKDGPRVNTLTVRGEQCCSPDDPLPQTLTKDKFDVCCTPASKHFTCEGRCKKI